jgi:hypothetical protein
MADLDAGEVWLLNSVCLLEYTMWLSQQSHCDEAHGSHWSWLPPEEVSPKVQVEPALSFSTPVPDSYIVTSTVLWVKS